LENEPGALSRVVGLFSARGYNIESLTVALYCPDRLDFWKAGSVSPMIQQRLKNSKPP